MSWLNPEFEGENQPQVDEPYISQGLPSERLSQAGH